MSFRFGPSDGVSVVTRTWVDAFDALGFAVVTVSGSTSPWPDVGHRVVAGLGIDDAEPVDAEALDLALADADVVVVENLLTIPVNLRASAAVAATLAGRPAVLHHHDPPWHRERFAHITELPATDDAWEHVAITDLLRRELGERGIHSTVIRNGFVLPRSTDDDALGALRRRLRTTLGVGEDELLVAHPVRAIERKDVPSAIRIAEELGGTYWLLGPPEEGYADELERLLAAASCPVVHRGWDDPDAVYAAADHVVFPSTWEGFGNPPVEASLRRRSVSVGPYPVAAELAGLGFDWFAAADVEGVRHALRHPDDPSVLARLDRNEQLARARFSPARVLAELRSLLDRAGWLP